jgi:hypothetical protein
MCQLRDWQVSCRARSVTGKETSFRHGSARFAGVAFGRPQVAPTGRSRRRSALCTTNVAFLREPRRFSTVSRQLQEAVVVVVVVAVAVAGVIPLVAAVRLRCVLSSPLCVLSGGRLSR